MKIKEKKLGRIIGMAFVLLLLTPAALQAQNAPVVDSEAYEGMKLKGQLVQPDQIPRQKKYPRLLDARDKSGSGKETLLGNKSVATNNAQSLQAKEVAIRQSFSCTIEDPRFDPSFRVLAVGDDGSSPEVPLSFTFNFFGNNYNSLYVNNNGSVTFDAPNPTYNATGFPSTFDMIAPFWTDIDTRGAGNGRIYYKSEPDRFTAIWYRVGYFREKTDKRNTFKLVITDGTNPIIGTGNNVAFYYGDMQWTTGDASGGVDGFGGVAATVGLNNGQGVDACFYYQLGRFSRRGSEYVDPFRPSGVDYLDNKCFTFDASTVEGVAIDFNYKNLLCAIDFDITLSNPQNCFLAYQWDFGDGTTSLERNPLHSYGAPGTYSVKLNVFYKCGACQETSLVIEKQIEVDPSVDLFMDTVIQVTTALKAEVLENSTSTFSDTWPLQHETQQLLDQSGYLNGSQGVWRQEGSYVYDVDRKQTPNITLSKDGTYDLEQFSWENAALDAIPDWIKTNTISVYSPYSYALENNNVLGVSNAALYDYGGHLPSANGVNMRNDEMAYTGFEYLTGKASGNWIFGNDPLPWYRWFSTLYNYKHIVVVKASLKELEGYNEADVYGRSYFSPFFFYFFNYRYIRGNEIVCRQPYGPNPEWSVLVFRRALFEGFWKGYIRVNNEITPIVSPDIDNTIAHSGVKSLKVTDDRSYEQRLIRLDSGKSYQLSAWVSVNDLHSPTPKLADGLGIDITLKDGDDLDIGTFSFLPQGRIIEGWQQVKGTFICPAVNTSMELQFRKGGKGTAWYDDLRIHPTRGNMRSYVYDLNDYRLQATLDEENFASFFYYDKEGNLYLTKKETEEGIKTLTESVTHLVER